MTYLAKDDPQVLLARYKNGDDSESDSIESFVDWLENEWDSELGHEKEEEVIQDILKVINQYVDAKLPMDKIILAEHRQLLAWTKAINLDKLGE